ncbi:hypothetical protein [Vibrio sonorensis]|uniref:hypothetical protein n=1 Tax=Vibrio sonorensis TaxID=1004316 RepID=UPI0008D8F34A|nr:hypothetical protein [Vibrio sonorensis]
MLNKIQSQDVTLHVSTIGPDGWWAGNKQEFVSEGTALGKEYTETLYTPSTPTKTAKFDGKKWVEREDNRLKPFYSQSGQEFLLEQPDGAFPEWAIFDKPPEFDAATHYLTRIDKQWLVMPFDHEDEPAPVVVQQEEPEPEPYIPTVQEKALIYLRATDFYVTRKIETGKAIPREVMDNRDKARAALVTELPSADFT